jgi:hypothetical protein
MQTILKLVCDNRGQAAIVDDYLTQFRAKVANDAQSIEVPSSDADDIAFVRDDAEEFRDECVEKQRAELGSFGRSSSAMNQKAQLIFVNPIILSCRFNEENLRLWVESPSPGSAGNAETE